MPLQQERRAHSRQASLVPAERLEPCCLLLARAVQGAVRQRDSAQSPPAWRRRTHRTGSHQQSAFRRQYKTYPSSFFRPSKRPNPHTTLRKHRKHPLPWPQPTMRSVGQTMSEFVEVKSYYSVKQQSSQYALGILRICTAPSLLGQFSTAARPKAKRPPPWGQALLHSEHLQALLVGLDHLLERVTRTTSVPLPPLGAARRTLPKIL